MEKTLRILNELERQGVIGRYAIGGAIAATFYWESVVTFDLDVFVVLPEKGGLVTLEPVYAALRQRGCMPDGEFVIIEGVPVQFLPAFNRLLGDALREALETVYGNVETRVMRVEHLIAIALQTGREKDRERVRMLLNAEKLDHGLLASICRDHGLEKEFRQLEKLSPEIARIFEAKEARRRKLAALPWPEKIKIVVKLQRMVAPIYAARGIKVRVWEIEE